MIDRQRGAALARGTGMPRFASLMAVLALTACVDDADVEDGANDSFPSGKADGGLDEGSPDALGVLALVNDPATTADSLKAGAHVTARVATNIINHRNGADGKVGTSDDNAFDTLAELDAIPYVGPKTLDALIAMANSEGLVHAGPKISVIFSPQPAATSHTAKIAALIQGAQHSVDIAIYSYSDAGIAQALADAVKRGVTVRFLFDTASTDHNLKTQPQRDTSKSGKIEATGVDVRYVNQVLHHKFIIVDGPRDDVKLAPTAHLAMGSANWSFTGAPSFDENTMFIEGSAELSAAYQHEFDILWRGSRDFVGPAPIQGPSLANVTTAMVPDDAGIEAKFTSANFNPGGSDGATWKVDKTKLTMSDTWVAAINRAQKSIHIASTHLRLRPVAEALIAKKKANPSIDIKIYLDQQEWMSASADAQQVKDLAACQAAATDASAQQDCLYNDFLFGKTVVDAGLDVKFKVYAYRWDATYAIQQHSKYMVVDGNELISGSYNLSMNSEHGTFENALHVTGAQYAPLISAFETNFATIWTTGAGNLDGLENTIKTSATIPMVFDSIAVRWNEFDTLRNLIRSNCKLADSDDFRNNAPAHKTCAR